MQYTLGEAIFIGFAVVLVIEGIGPMLFAEKWQRYLQLVVKQPINQLRATGGVLVTIGLVSLFYLL